MTDLRVAINLANTQLVTGRADDGSPSGPAIDFATRVAAELRRSPKWVEYDNPAAIVEAATRDEWDICLIADDPARAEHVLFTRPWIHLDVCFAAPAASAFRVNADVDVAGVRVATLAGGAYTHWMERNLTSAELLLCDTIDDSEAAGRDGRADVVVGLRARFVAGGQLRAFDETVMTVDQAVGVRRDSGERLVKTIRAIVEQLCDNDGIR